MPKRAKTPFGTSAKPQGKLPHAQAGHFAGIPFYLDKIDVSQWEYRLPSSTDSGMGIEMAELEDVPDLEGALDAARRQRSAATL